MSFAALAPRYSVNAPTISSARCSDSAIARSPKIHGSGAIDQAAKYPAWDSGMQRPSVSGGFVHSGVPAPRLVAALQIAASFQSYCWWHLVYIKFPHTTKVELLRYVRKGTFMSKTASIGLLPSPTLRSPDSFHRPSADRASSRIAARNGELPLRPPDASAIRTFLRATAKSHSNHRLHFDQRPRSPRPFSFAANRLPI